MLKSADFPKKIVKLPENFSTFSEKFYDFFKKICRFIQENFTVFIGKCDWTLFTETFDDLDFP